MRGALHPTRIDIPLEIRVKVIDELGILLASCSDFYSQSKQAHWNIKGSRFQMLHELFDKIADPFPDYVDALAERITALGGTAMGTVRMAAMSSVLPEFPYTEFSEEVYLDAVATRLATITKTFRDKAITIKEAGDPTTENYLLETAMEIDKLLYFVESHLSI
jgi:starvation-inducible DNA-binding protein